MNDSLKHIEEIENFVEGKLPEKERITFEERLKTDTELAEELQLYRQIIEGVKANAIDELKQNMQVLDKKLDQSLIIEKEPAIKSPAEKKSFGYKKVGVAAGILLLITVSLYYFVFRTPENKQLYAQFHIKDKGLPVTMSATGNPMNRVMNFYKLDDYKEALQAVSQLPENDTAVFYRAVILMESQKFQEAVNDFKSVPANSTFYFKSQYYSGLCELATGNKKSAKQFFSEIAGTHNHPFATEAKQLLQEPYFNFK